MATTKRQLRIGPLSSDDDRNKAIRDIEQYLNSGGIISTRMIQPQAVTQAVVDPSVVTGVPHGAALPSASGYFSDVFYLESDGKLYRKTTDGLAWQVAVPTVDLTGQIANAQIVDAAITAVKIATNAVTTTKILDGSITTPKLVANVITANEIAAGAVTTAKIAALAVTTATLDAGAVTTAKLAANSVTSNELAANSVIAGKIAAAVITSTEIASHTITASNIAAGTITATEIAAATITGAKIAAATITGSLIAANTITAANIVAATITSSELAANSVTTTQLAAASVTAAKISVTTLSAITADLGTITAGLVRDTNSKFKIDLANAILTVDDSQGTPVRRINLGKLDATTTGYGIQVYDASGNLILGATGLGANVVTTSTVAGSAITASKIAAGSIDATKISVSTLSAISADVGTLTAGIIQNSGATRGILLSGSLPGGWTTYLNLLATGTNPILHHPGLDLNADGSANFSGTISAATVSAGSVSFTSTSAIILFPAASASLGQTPGFQWQDTGLGVSSYLDSDGTDIRLRPNGAVFIRPSSTNFRVATVITSSAAPSGTAIEGTLWLKTSATKAIHVYTGGAWTQIV